MFHRRRPWRGATIKDGSLFGLSKADRGLFYHVEVPSSANELAITPPDIEINGALVQVNKVTFKEQTSTRWTGLCQ